MPRNATYDVYLKNVTTSKIMIVSLKGNKLLILNYPVSTYDNLYDAVRAIFVFK